MAKNSPSPIIVPETPNVSLVSFYGKKPPDFEALLLLLQGYLSNELLRQFTPLPLPQIHGTLLGCEGGKTPQGILSQWFLKKRNQQRQINLAGLIDAVDQFEKLSVQIRLAGYHATIDYGFKSREQHPYFRSFQFQNRKAVLRGWPFYQSRFPEDIGNFRDSAQTVNVLHKHQPQKGVDNDFYLRIGNVDSDIPESKLAAIETKIQEFLRIQSPLLLTLNQSSIAFVQYQDLSLPPQTTQSFPIQAITVETLAQLYPEATYA
ncbi:MAG: hypothetical protein WBA77_03690 [Microcoleaceae cyanobacterium]